MQWKSNRKSYVGYWMAPLPMPLKVTFDVWNLSNSHSSWNIARIYQHSMLQGPSVVVELLVCQWFDAVGCDKTDVTYSQRFASRASGGDNRQLKNGCQTEAWRCWVEWSGVWWINCNTGFDLHQHNRTLCKESYHTQRCSQPLKTNISKPRKDIRSRNTTEWQTDKRHGL